MRGRLSAAAAAHSVRVGDTAAALADRYGVDPDNARLAGLLHDWDRERNRTELLGDAERSHEVVDPVEREVPYLLHARTGAEGVREAFPDMPAEVLDAIAKHTVGALKMSPLDMVVYLADMIEPSRDFPGVAELREAVGSVSLEALFADAYRQSVMYLVGARKHIHPETVAVWNTYVAGAKP